jgi:Lectin C-type domain
VTLTIIAHISSNYMNIFAGVFNQLEDFWISASDLGRDGDFYWESTGEFFGIFDDWMEGEPALGIEKHHCAHMDINAPNSNETHHWRNGNCYERKRFVCESFQISTSLDSKFPAPAQVNDGNQSNSFVSKTSIYEISTDKVKLFIIIASYN